MKCVVVVLNICCGLLPLMADDPFPEPVNTQAAGEHPPTPLEMLDLFELPPGFKVSLFAGEPDVQQPIAFEFDDVGRIWVAENYSYGAHGKFDPNLRDRVIILHDKDGDGEHDERKVFWDKGWMLTGLTWGYGGLWILNDGTLSFIPDRDGDDIPDSEPVEMLNGWTKGAGHNVVNGLLWGPDGWLYGRHGITDTSLPGTPDTPESERSPMNCGIWRFHPVKHQFEIVCHGTTNPWGLDYNADGDFFMSNNVIGHLWHVIPGAHYERMFGQDFNPHLYELMPQTADHYHWDDTGKWNESRDGAADHLGGGHSHCGLMIYQETHFPEQYRGKAFMCNTHGRCINVDRLERQGSSYVAKHEPNFLKVNTPWFRGVTIKSGPAGCVYLSDWSDNGECHDHDGVHRTSGRIYRISYGDPQTNAQCVRQAAERASTFKTQSTKQLIRTLIESYSPIGGRTFNGTEWHQRRRRRLVHERLWTHRRRHPELSPTEDQFWRSLSEDSDQTELDRTSLRKFLGNLYHRRSAVETAWLFGAIDAFDADSARRALLSGFPVIRAFAVRHVSENIRLREQVRQTFYGLLRVEQSPMVWMAYASGLQMLPSAAIVGDAERDAAIFARWREGELDGAEILQLLGKYTPAADVMQKDRNLRLMTWYGALHHDLTGLTLPKSVQLEAFATRYGIERALSRNPDGRDLGFTLAQIIPDHGNEKPDDRQLDRVRRKLDAVLTAAAGYRKLPEPSDWQSTKQQLTSLDDEAVDRAVQRLSVLFGDGAGIEELHALIRQRDGDHTARSQAIRTIVQSGQPESVPVLLSLLNDRAVYVDVAAGLANFDDPRIPAELLKRWDNLRHGAQEAAADTLVSRRSYAVELAAALNEGTVTAQQLTATQVRQLISFDDPKITAAVEDKWGIINDSSAARSSSIERWKQTLTAETLADADLSAGAALFRKSCANCHRMYGEGGKIGPDLTGSNRNNLDYLLSNIIDPSAVVPKQFTVSTIVLKSGRIVNGVVVAETNSTISVQTDKELKVIALADIDERVRTNKSLMPDGLLDPLSETQVRDLIAYLQHRR